jgi:Protein of unknown function (DUF1778).
MRPSKKSKSFSELASSTIRKNKRPNAGEVPSIKLSRKAAEEFVRLMTNPPAPNERLIRAARLHDEWMRNRR